MACVQFIVLLNMADAGRDRKLPDGSEKVRRRFDEESF